MESRSFQKARLLIKVSSLLVPLHIREIYDLNLIIFPGNRRFISHENAVIELAVEEASSIVPFRWKAYHDRIHFEAGLTYSGTFPPATVSSCRL